MSAVSNEYCRCLWCLHQWSTDSEAYDSSSRREHEFVTGEGLDLICGSRMEHYGPPQHNLGDIAASWTPYVKRALATRDALDGTDVCALMIILKVIRQARGYNRDSTTDICGYAGLAEVLNEPEAFEAFVLRAANEIKNPDERAAFVKRLLNTEEDE